MKSLSKHRWQYAVAATAACAMALTACSSGGGSTQSDSKGTASGESGGGVITAGVAYDMNSGFDPGTTSGALPLAANWHVFEGLMDRDPVTAEPYLALAKEEPKKVDDKTYEVTLRDGAKFSNGDPVTVDDVVFSFSRILDPEKKETGLYRAFLPFIEKVEKKDDTTVVIKLKYPYALLKERLPLVKIVPQKVVEAGEDAFKAKPTGSGPYMITEATPKSVVKFEKNPNYNGPKPAGASGMEWKVLGDDSARLTAMQSNTAMAIESVPAIAMQSGQLATGDTKAEAVDSFGLAFMMFNTKKAPFNDKRVRQAFFYAINYDELVKTGLMGLGNPATSYLQESHPDYQRAATVYNHDVEKAKALLKEAGQENLSLKLNITNHAFLKSVGPMVQQNLKEAGINVELQEADSAGTYKQVDSGDYSVLIAPGDPSVFGNDPDILLRWWYGKNIWSETRYGWADSPEFAKIQELLDQAAQTEDKAAAKANYKQVYDIIADNAVLYPLFHRKLPTAWNAAKLDGFKPVSTTGLSFMGVSVK
ncbi:hypothetical protein BSR29_05960 [Boudabousia liubingyangii]|uniref:Solute-binding protein family 5 domain-containing protein n=1 Tax=Boudabousia liubingyangii TaxID=1921764 RepID=A0A1Q5PKK4_9ACTO|nr:ABC transporter substrate-binding protein [Boudabousia liubingyangii]OKL46511.1 hypothetical protein BSR28_08320 [Boudabousia liubingyangii]OKL47168.1 hypothetical protein BSR29_05960 [Boudabousia liubingyangii]